MFALRPLRRATSAPAVIRAYSSKALRPSRGSSKRQTIFSGIQPTGVPHVGNYLGAMRQWVEMEKNAHPDDTLIFSIADLHALTVNPDPDQLKRWRREMFASLLAVGLNPERSIIFEQNTVYHHAELMWVLSCSASMGYLGRMTQWKSKTNSKGPTSPPNKKSSKRDRSLRNKASPKGERSPPPEDPQDDPQDDLEDEFPINYPIRSSDVAKLGLFSYPVLQAADILLYRSTHVPVGEDQAQHIEFTRDLANGFNFLYSDGPKVKPILTIPQTVLCPAKRVMSLTEPTQKMSKSASNPKSRILISDSKEEIHAKIKAALTDSIEGITYDREARPGVTNLVDLLYHFDTSAAASPEELATQIQHLSMRAFKEKVADTVNDGIRDVRERYEELMGAQESILQVHLDNGTSKATEKAAQTMATVFATLGLRDPVGGPVY